MILAKRLIPSRWVVRAGNAIGFAALTGVFAGVVVLGLILRIPGGDFFASIPILDLMCIVAALGVGGTASAFLFKVHRNSRVPAALILTSIIASEIYLLFNLYYRPPGSDWTGVVLCMLLVAIGGTALGIAILPVAWPVANAFLRLFGVLKEEENA